MLHAVAIGNAYKSRLESGENDPESFKVLYRSSDKNPYISEDYEMESSPENGLAIQCSCIAICAATNAPVYCLDADLQEAFENTTAPKIMLPVLASLVVAFPKRTGSIYAGSFLHLCLGGPYGKDESVVGTLCTRMPDSTIAMTCISLRDGEQIKEEPNKELKKLHSLIANILAYMRLKGDEFLLEEDSCPSSKRGVGFSSTESSVLSPRWIKRKAKKITRSLGGTHASPLMHWRRGHWHTYKVGKGRAEEKLNWVEPVLVNANPS